MMRTLTLATAVLLATALLLASGDARRVSSSAVSVDGHAQAFIGDERIVGATVTWLETGLQTTTDAQGEFSFENVTVGQNITVVVEASGYHTTQSATVTIPPQGLHGAQAELAMQVPRTLTFGECLHSRVVAPA